MYAIDPSRTDLVEEFRKTPVGHHSPELQKVMNLLRAERFPGKHVLICTKPFKGGVRGKRTGQQYSVIGRSQAES